MHAIFISYRRDDSAGHAGHLSKDLTRIFGQGSVFMDVDAIAPGLDFRKVIDQQVAACNVLLAIIGKAWLTASNEETGKRRLDDPLDFVRLEIASALKRDIPVVPVLVHGGRLARAEDLPEDIRELAYRNGVELRDTRWDSDVDQLAKALQPYARAERQPSAPPAPAPKPARRMIIAASAGVLGLLGLGVAAYLWQQRTPADIPVVSTSPAQTTAPAAEREQIASVAAAPAKPADEAANRPTPQAQPTGTANAPAPKKVPQKKTPPKVADATLATTDSSPIKPAPGPLVEPAPTASDPPNKPLDVTPNGPSFSDWQGAWRLQWEFEGKWYEKPMTIRAGPIGITGTYEFGGYKARFAKGDFSKVAGQYTTTNGVTCASGRQEGRMAFTMDADGRHLSGWWDVCGAGTRWAWRADKR